LIEAGSKEEIEIIRDSITEKCGKELTAKVQELRNPRVVTYNIPGDITLDNATEIIREQNSELQLKERDITAKFIYRTKRNTRNLVIEMSIFPTFRRMKDDSSPPAKRPDSSSRSDHFSTFRSLKNRFLASDETAGLPFAK
jgi:hypothetical protein